MATLISIVLAAVLTNNFITAKTYGICPFLGVSKKLDSAVGMGLAVTFVIVLSSIVCHYLYMLLELLSITYLQTILFILIIAALVQLLDIVLKKASPSLYTSLGVYLALITTNCAVLGTANTVVQNGYGLLETFVSALSGGLGFTLALILMAGVREKVGRSAIPKPFQGFPIALIIAGILAMAFYGFSNFSLF